MVPSRGKEVDAVLVKNAEIEDEEARINLGQNNGRRNRQSNPLLNKTTINQSSAMRIDQMDPTEESKSVNRKATIQGTATLGATNIEDYMYATDGKRA